MANKPAKRILVLRYRYIGDALLTIPFLRALRAKEPDAEITLCLASDAFPALAHCPYVNHVESFDPKTLGFWTALSWLKAKQFDCAYILKRSFSSALMVFLAGIPKRIGFDTDFRRFLLTQSIPYRSQTQHEAQCTLDLLGPISEEPDLRLEAWLPDTAYEEAQKRLASLPESTCRIVLHATSTNSAKCWPVGHFAILAQWFVFRHHAQIFFLGPASDTTTYQSLINTLPPSIQSACHNWCGQTSLPVSMALLKQMDLVVANDSGMVHMASAMDTPLVAIFGPMDPVQWRPLSSQAHVITHGNLPCQPCRLKISCDNLFPCLTELSPQQVYEACLNYLKP